MTQKTNAKTRPKEKNATASNANALWKHQPRVQQNIPIPVSNQHTVHPNLPQPTQRENLQRRVIDEIIHRRERLFRGVLERLPEVLLPVALFTNPAASTPTPAPASTSTAASTAASVSSRPASTTTG
jgi:hypothetical protein